MQIKAKEKNGSFEWFKFTTGQKASFDTKTHKTQCFNGIGRDITHTDIGKKMISLIENYADWEGKKMKYIVWVGGVPDYEGGSLKKAKIIYTEWVNLGYEDVILQTVNEG